MDETKLNVVRIKLIDDTPLFGNELIQSADDAIFLMQKELRNCDRETFCALHLNAKGKLLSMSVVSIGELRFSNDLVSNDLASSAFLLLRRKNAHLGENPKIPVSILTPHLTPLTLPFNSPYVS